MGKALCVQQDFGPVAAEVLLVQDISGYTWVCESLRRLQKDKIKALPLVWRAAIIAYSKKPWQDWMLNFITNLLPSVYQRQVFDVVLVVVDEYTKFARYIPACKDWKAEDMVNVLVKEVLTKYNKSVFFADNCNLLFTSKFWSHLCYYLSI